jgi:hypothetical protein
MKGKITLSLKVNIDIELNDACRCKLEDRAKHIARTFEMQKFLDFTDKPGLCFTADNLNCADEIKITTYDYLRYVPLNIIEK